jgi:chromate reductase
MNNEIKVAGIAGSLRKKSLNHALLRAALELKPENMSIEILDISQIPLYNDDLFSTQIPEAVENFKNKIAGSDGILIATPEYNYSISGVLKNAIDWASRPALNSPLNNKPLGIMGVSGGISGTMKAQMHLRQVSVFTNMIPMNKPEMIVQKGREKFDSEGKLTDENTREHLRKFLAAIAVWIERVKPKD